MNIELLEDRITPNMSTLSIVDAHTATFNDVDGDRVTVKVSTGRLTSAVMIGGRLGVGDQLQSLDLTAPEFQNANVSIVATRDPVKGGDGLVNVGYLNAKGRDLGTVLVDGDVARIDAGDQASPANACQSLTVQSLGRYGTTTGAQSLI